MTRYGGLGRTRPKKLTPKASIPIVSEHEIDAIEEEIQNGLQQIETGVEKAEESVRAPTSLVLFDVSRDDYWVTMCRIFLKHQLSTSTC